MCPQEPLTYPRYPKLVSCETRRPQHPITHIRICGGHGCLFRAQSSLRPAGPATCATQGLFRENFDGQLRCRSHCSTVALHQRENFPFKCGGARLGVGGRPRVGVANSSHLPAARRRRRTFAHPALLYEFHNGFDHRVPIHLSRSKRGVCFPPKQPLPDLLRGGKQYRSSSRGPAPPPPPSSSSGGKERGGKEDGKERWIRIVFLLTTPAPPRCSAVAAR